MSESPKVLLVEDDADVAAAVRQVLEDDGFRVDVEARGDRAVDRLETETVDVVLTDLRLPGLDGLEIVRRLRAARPRLPVILVTAHGTTETAIEATKQGAFDYVLKPFDFGELLALLRSAVAAGRRMTEPVGLGGPSPTGLAMVGQSRRMQAVYKEIGRVAGRPLSVLIRGETGTGKELVARAIYQHSDRAAQPFVAVNCAALPEALIESELFGHERGAFTGAEARRIGRFEQADRGTLFLDEIGDLTPATQVKLLRVLQERTFQRLGGRETLTADVRVLAATHRDLEGMVAAGEFREDLYYRLAVAVIRVPALRERLEDLAELVAYFVGRHGADLGYPATTFPAAALDRLREHAWPGNVRELENTVRKAILRAQGYPVTREQVEAVLGPVVEARAAGEGGATLAGLADTLLARAEAGEIEDARARLMQAADRELLARAMQRAGGNLAQAARWLGLSRFTLREKLRQLGLRAGGPGGDGA